MARASAFAALLLAGLLAAALLPYGSRVALAAAGEAGGSAADQPGQVRTEGGGQREIECFPDKAWTWPGWGFDRESRTDRVFQAFPQDGAVFSPGMVVTLGWQPVDPAKGSVERYEVVVFSDQAGFQRFTPGLNESGRPTFLMYSPPAPGEYAWQVVARLPGGLSIPSVLRRFTVLP